LAHPSPKHRITPPPVPLQANAAMTSSTTSNLLQFLHASLFLPVPSTLIKAIQNNHFTTWPGITTANTQQHLPKAMATTLGHLDQERKNLRSTKPVLIPPSHQPEPISDDTEFLPSPPILDGLATNYAYASIEPLPERTDSITTDQTGQFPVLSSTGMRYVLVLYDYDSNAILAEPLKNRTGTEIHRAYKKHPKLQQLDNECSTLLKKFMTHKNVDFQLGPPHLHRRNAAERAI
jgi:hypothetical protein